MDTTKITEIKSLINDNYRTQLGTYTFKNGAIATAICVLPDKNLGFDYPPLGTITKGIECVLVGPKISHKRYFDGYLQKARIDIYLKDFGNGANLLNLTEEIFGCVFSLRYLQSDPVYIQGNKAANIIPQSQFSVYVMEDYDVSFIR